MCSICVGDSWSQDSDGHISRGDTYNTTTVFRIMCALGHVYGTHGLWVLWVLLVKYPVTH